MKRVGWLLIGLLSLISAGCTRRDWVSDMLVLADVTGTWTGTLVSTPGNNRQYHRALLSLQQSGAKVTGALTWQTNEVELEGLVSGEVLAFRGRPLQAGITMSGELRVDGDELSGEVEGFRQDYCPCLRRFRRESPEPRPQS